MVSHGRGGLAGPHACDRTLTSARDSDSSLREPEPLDEGDLSPHRVSRRGGVFPQNIKVAPLSGATVFPLDSISTRIGTPMGFGTCEPLDEHVSDSTKWRSDRDSAHGETI